MYKVISFIICLFINLHHLFTIKLEASGECKPLDLFLWSWLHKNIVHTEHVTWKQKLGYWAQGGLGMLQSEED